MDKATENVLTIGLAVISLAALAVFLSQNSSTPKVIQSLFSGLGNVIGQATAPITGNGGSVVLNYPS